MDKNTFFICPICGTDEDKEVTLVSIAGTNKGWNIEAIQVHVSCLELTISAAAHMGMMIYHDGKISNNAVWKYINRDREKDNEP
jgi:hypothetical protein